jgi:hypothetical protein
MTVCTNSIIEVLSECTTHDTRHTAAVMHVSQSVTRDRSHWHGQQTSRSSPWQSPSPLYTCWQV